MLVGSTGDTSASAWTCAVSGSISVSRSSSRSLFDKCQVCSCLRCFCCRRDRADLALNGAPEGMCCFLTRRAGAAYHGPAGRGLCDRSEDASTELRPSGRSPACCVPCSEGPLLLLLYSLLALL